MKCFLILAALMAAALDSTLAQVLHLHRLFSDHTIGNLSAAAYFFIRDVSQETGVLIGIITSDCGGTPVDVPGVQFFASMAGRIVMGCAVVFMMVALVVSDCAWFCGGPWCFSR